MTLRSKLLHSRTKVDSAGSLLLQSIDSDEPSESALSVLNDWRSFHTFPLNSTTIALKQKARRIQNDALVVQRLKRSRSIVAKLTREPHMRLTQMQDIGGCRAVLDSIDAAYELKDSYVHSKGQYEIVHIDDYTLTLH